MTTSPLGQLAVEPEQSAPQEPSKVSVGFIVVFSLAMLGFWMSISLPSNVTLALRVAEIDPLTKTTSYSLIAGIGGLVGVLAAPVFGQLSDFTRSRFGRRRPWIVVGLAGITVGAVILGLSNTIPMMILGWVIMQMFLYAGVSAMYAIVSDRVPSSQSGLVGSLAATAASMSLVIGLPLIELMPTSVLAQFGIPVAIAIVFGLVLVAMFKDDKPYVGAERYGIKQFFSSFAFNPRKTPDFARLIAAYFLFFMGASVLGTYGVYFLQDRIGVSPDELSSVLFLSFLAPAVLTLAIAPLTGVITDKLGRRKPALFIAAPLAGIGILVTAFSSDATQYMIGYTITAGIAGSIASGIMIPFFIDSIKDRSSVARNLGFANLVTAIPYSLVPFMAPFILGIGSDAADNYVLLYVVAAVLAVAALPFVLSMRHTR